MTMLLSPTKPSQPLSPSTEPMAPLVAMIGTMTPRKLRTKSTRQSSMTTKPIPTRRTISCIVTSDSSYSV